MRSNSPADLLHFLSASRLRGLMAAGCVMLCALGLAWGQEPATGKAIPADPANGNAKPAAVLPALPPDFVPPRAIPEVMIFTKELITPAELDKLDKALKRGRHASMLRSAELNDANKALVDTWARFSLYQMTLVSNQKRLHELREQMMRDISYAGKGQSDGKKVERFREYVCEQVTKYADELLTNNFQVRLNAVMVLGSLNLTDADAGKQLKERAYVPAVDPLLKVLKAKTSGQLDGQLEAVKIRAAIGVGRIALWGEPVAGKLDVTRKNSIANTLIGELQDPNAFPWYQKCLLEALSSIDLVTDLQTGKPIILQTLGEVMADKRREFCVRARAARALGRCPLPAAVNVNKLVFQMLLLSNEMAAAYQEKPNEYYWLECFGELYFAFHPENADETALYGRPAGLLQQNRGNVVQDAYTQLLPIASHVVNQPLWDWRPTDTDINPPKNAPLPDNLVSNLAKWLQDHQPTDHRLAPNLPNLNPISPMPAAEVGSTNRG